LQAVPFYERLIFIRAFFVFSGRFSFYVSVSRLTFLLRFQSKSFLRFPSSGFLVAVAYLINLPFSLLALGKTKVARCLTPFCYLFMMSGLSHPQVNVLQWHDPLPPRSPPTFSLFCCCLLDFAPTRTASEFEVCWPFAFFRRLWSVPRKVTWSTIFGLFCLWPGCKSQGSSLEFPGSFFNFRCRLGILHRFQNPVLRSPPARTPHLPPPPFFFPGPRYFHFAPLKKR